MTNWLDHLSNAGKFISDGIDKFRTFKKDHDIKSFKDIKFKQLLESDTLKKYVEKTGLKVDNLAEITQGGFLKHLGTVLQSQHGLMALGTTALNVGGDIGQGNYAAAMGTLLSEGSKIFSDTPGIISSYAKGNWVYVDNGEEMHTRKERATIFWGEGAMFGDMPEQEDEELATEHVITIGFVTEPVTGDGEIDIFDLESGDIRRFRIQDVRHVSESKAKALDETEEMTIMKDVILGEKPTLDRVVAETPIDPGSEVTYDGKVYNVLEAQGDLVRIQSGEKTLTVGAQKLQRGRTTHSNVWHYHKHHQTPTGFDRDVKPGLHKGMWIWVPSRAKAQTLFPSSEWELGCVRLLSGYNVDGYYALDGERLIVLEDHVVIVKNAQDEWLNSHRFFKQFHHHAMEGGHSVRAWNLGQHFPRLCCGVGVKWAPVKTIPVEGGVVEEGHIVVGKTQGELLGAPTPQHDEVITEGDPLPVLDAAYQSDRNWGVKWNRAGEGDVDVATLAGAKNSTGSMVMVLAALGIVGCIYFLR